MEQIMVDKLIAKARQASEKAYCPNSETPVGACVLTQNGMVFTGCNIEISAYAGSLGAMEVALSKAISEGATAIRMVVNFCERELVFPSGSEREFMKEFASNSTIICATDGRYEQFQMRELLPFSMKN